MVRSKSFSIVLTCLSVIFCGAACLCFTLLFLYPLLTQAPVPKHFSVTASVSRFFDADNDTVDADKAFQVGSNVFYSGDEDLGVDFDFSAEVSAISTRIVMEGGTQIIETTAPIAGGFPWNLHRNDSCKFYKLYFQIWDSEGNESDWQEVITVYNARNYESPTKIKAAFDLHLLSARVCFGFDSYKLKTVSIEEDVILPNYQNNHIQIGSAKFPTFLGTIVGNFCKISNINMSKKNTSLAFFNDFGGVLKDLNISGSIHVDGEEDEVVAAGFALTANNATIINFRSSINVSVTSESGAAKASGFFGKIMGSTTIIGSAYSGTVSSPGMVGAFAVILDNIGVAFNIIGCTDEGVFTDPDGTPALIIETFPFTSAPVGMHLLVWVDYNGSSVTQEPESIFPTPPSPALLGDDDYVYNFQGWETESGNSPSIVTGSEIYYARYELIRKKYTLTWTDYDGAQQTTIGLYNVVPTPPAMSRPNEGSYKFILIGWNTSPQQPGDYSTVTLDPVETDSKYYAVYKSVFHVGFTINYDENWPSATDLRTGTVPSSQTVSYGEFLTVGPPKDGLALSASIDGGGVYDFIGWSTDPNATWGSAARLFAGDALLDASDYTEGDSDCEVTLYAVWVPNSAIVHTVTVDYGNIGGVPVTLTITAVLGTTLDLSLLDAPAVNDDDEVFAGWSTMMNGAPLGSYEVNSSITLYAVYL